MNSDMVKPMPASAPAPASCRQEYAAGFSASPSLHREPRGEHEARAACRRRARTMIASISSSWPPNTSVRDHDARVREREYRQHDVARARRDVAQQPIGGRFEPVVDGIERAQRRRRRPCRSTLAAVAAPRRRGSASACATSALRSGGGRVGMNSASSTPASVACRPPACTQAHSTMPTSTYGVTRYTRRAIQERQHADDAAAPTSEGRCSASE